MEQPYNTRTNDRQKTVRASRETVKFLLDYSSSLSIVSSRGLVFENNLN